MRLAACQLPDVRGDRARSLSLLSDFVRDAERQRADLVCFPECFLQGYFTDIGTAGRLAIHLDSPEFADVLECLAAWQPAVVFGLIENHGSELYNSAVIVQAGKLICHYRKRNLLNAEAAVFHAGDSASVVNVRGTMIGVNICYDFNFPETISASAHAGAQLIVCPSNNMMAREDADKWKARHTEIRCLRARESGVWVLSSDVCGERNGCISYGPTSLISPDGKLVAQVEAMRSGMILCDVFTNSPP